MIIILREKRKKGFTIIELIVVIAVLGIGVLIAAPKFLGHTNDAKLTQIKNDILVYETEIGLMLLENDEFIEGLNEIDSEILENSDSVFSRKGKVKDNYIFDDKYFEIKRKDLKIKSSLPDKFIVSLGGEVYYLDENVKVSDNSGGSENPGTSLPESNAPEDFVWTTQAGIGQTIVGYKGTKTDVIIPKTIEGLPVVAIGDNAFKLGGGNVSSALTSVTIPEGVTVIGRSAFQGNQLTSVDLPSTLKSIQNSAFKSNKLTSVVIPEGVISMIGYTFQSNEIVSVSLPSTLQSIGVGTFENNKLKSVTIPGKVGSIDNSAFENNELTEVIIQNGTYYIGESAFKNNQITSLTLPESLGTISDSAFSKNKLTSLNFPDSIYHIGYSAFSSNELTSINLPSTIEEISEMSFSNNRLTSVNIPSYVTVIGDSAFYKNKLTSVSIPEGVERIEINAFLSNELTSVKVPSTVTAIGYGAFMSNPIKTVENYSPVNLNVSGQFFTGSPEITDY